MDDYIKTERGDRPDVIIQDESIIKPGAADIVLLCTDSFTKEAFPKMKYILEQKINVITSAEEMAFPAAQNPELAAELDKNEYSGLANKNTVSISSANIILIVLCCNSYS